MSPQELIEKIIFAVSNDDDDDDDDNNDNDDGDDADDDFIVNDTTDEVAPPSSGYGNYSHADTNDDDVILKKSLDAASSHQSSIKNDFLDWFLNRNGKFHFYGNCWDNKNLFFVNCQELSQETQQYIVDYPAEAIQICTTILDQHIANVYPHSTTFLKITPRFYNLTTTEKGITSSTNKIDKCIQIQARITSISQKFHTVEGQIKSTFEIMVTDGSNCTQRVSTHRLKLICDQHLGETLVITNEYYFVGILKAVTPTNTTCIFDYVLNIFSAQLYTGFEKVINENSIKDILEIDPVKLDDILIDNFASSIAGNRLIKFSLILAMVGADSVDFNDRTVRGKFIIATVILILSTWHA